MKQLAFHKQAVSLVLLIFFFGQSVYAQTDFRDLRRVLGYLPKEFNAVEFSEQQQSLLLAQWKTLQAQQLMEFQQKQRIRAYILDLLNQEQRLVLGDQKRELAYKGIHKHFGALHLREDQELQMYRFLLEKYTYPSLGVPTTAFSNFGKTLLTPEQRLQYRKRQSKEQEDAAQRAAKFEDRWVKKADHAEDLTSYMKRRPARRIRRSHRKVWKKMHPSDRKLVDSLRQIYQQRLEQIREEKMRLAYSPAGAPLAPRQLKYHLANLNRLEHFPSFEPFYKFAYGFHYDPRKVDFLLKSLVDLRDRYYAKNSKVQKRVDKHWKKIERKRLKILRKHFPEAKSIEDKSNPIPSDMKKLERMLPLFLIQ